MKHPSFSSRSIGAFICLLVLCVTAAEAAEVQRDRALVFSQIFYETLRSGTREAESQIPAMTRAGEAVAKRLQAGGGLLMASVRPDFADEGVVRAGGLMLAKKYTPEGKLSSSDAVIVGWTNTSPDEDLKLVQRLHKTGAYVVGIGPLPPATHAAEHLAHCDVHLVSSLKIPAPVTACFGGHNYPLISLQNLAILWAFQGELVSALTRVGLMPTMYQSVLVPGARKRNEPFHGRPFHERGATTAVPPGKLGRNYLIRLGEIFETLRDKETRNINEVAFACTRVKKEGHQIYAYLIPHFPVYQTGVPGDPKFMVPLEEIHGETPGQEELAKKLHPGDLLFFLGYARRPGDAYQLARKKGAITVEIITGMGKKNLPGPEPDHVIYPHWPYYDAMVTVPGYDIPVLPSSGIVQTSIYWAVLGSMVAITKEEARAPNSGEQ